MGYKCYKFTDETTFDSIMNNDIEYAVEDDNYFYIKNEWCEGDLGSEAAIRIDKKDRSIVYFYEADCALERGNDTGDYTFLTYVLYKDHQVTKEDIINHFKEKAA